MPSKGRIPPLFILLIVAFTCVGLVGFQVLKERKIASDAISEKEFQLEIVKNNLKELIVSTRKTQEERDSMQTKVTELEHASKVAMENLHTKELELQVMKDEHKKAIDEVQQLKKDVNQRGNELLREKELELETMKQENQRADEVVQQLKKEVEQKEGEIIYVRGQLQEYAFEKAKESAAEELKKMEAAAGVDQQEQNNKGADETRQQEEDNKHTDEARQEEQDKKLADEAGQKEQDNKYADESGEQDPEIKHADDAGLDDRKSQEDGERASTITSESTSQGETDETSEAGDGLSNETHHEETVQDGDITRIQQEMDERSMPRDGSDIGINDADEDRQISVADIKETGAEDKTEDSSKVDALQEEEAEEQDNADARDLDEKESDAGGQEEDVKEESKSEETLKDHEDESVHEVTHGVE